MYLLTEADFQAKCSTCVEHKLCVWCEDGANIEIIVDQRKLNTPLEKLNTPLDCKENYRSSLVSEKQLTQTENANQKPLSPKSTQTGKFGNHVLLCQVLLVD